MAPNYHRVSPMTQNQALSFASVNSFNLYQNPIRGVLFVFVF